MLSELAAFERLMLDVFDEPDASRASVSDLQAIPADDGPDLRLRFHPSVHSHHTETNAVEIWQALKASTTPPVPTAECPAACVLWRGTDRLSQLRSLSDTEILALNAAIRGSDFAHLCECLLPELPEPEISATVLNYLLDWLDRGLVRHLESPRPG